MSIIGSIIVFFLLSFFISGCLILLVYGRKKSLKDSDKVFYTKKIKSLKNNNNRKELIIESDKIYHKILLSIGYKGSFGNILKLKPREIGDLNKVWKLHKLRNKLVHDLTPVSERVLEGSSREYILYTKQLLDIVSK